MEQDHTTQEEKTDTVSEWECGMCGRDGGPVDECDLCHGNQTFKQSRAFTLTEERQGKNPNTSDRYGPHGEVGPKIVLLPGGAMPGSAGPR